MKSPMFNSLTVVVIYPNRFLNPWKSPPKSSLENLKFDDVVDSLMGEEWKKNLFLKHSTNESISMRLVQ